MTEKESQRVKQGAIWFTLVLFIIFVGNRRIEKWAMETTELENRVINATVALRRINRNKVTLTENRKAIDAELLRAKSFVESLPSRQNLLDRLDQVHALARKHGLEIEEGKLSPDKVSPFALEDVELGLAGSYEGLRDFLEQIEGTPSLACLVSALRVRGGKGEGLEGNLTLSFRSGWPLPEQSRKGGGKQ